MKWEGVVSRLERRLIRPQRKFGEVQKHVPFTGVVDQPNPPLPIGLQRSRRTHDRSRIVESSESQVPRVRENCEPIGVRRLEIPGIRRDEWGQDSDNRENEYDREPEQPEAATLEQGERALEGTLERVEETNRVKLDGRRRLFRCGHADLELRTGRLRRCFQK